MKSITRPAGVLVIGLFVALVALVLLYPAKGMYFGRSSGLTSAVLNVNTAVLMLIATWGVFRSQPWIIRFSSTLALSGLVTANLAFSAFTTRVMARLDGFALMVCFVLLPWLIMTSIKSIPRFGMQIGRLHKDEIQVTRQPLRLGDLVATTLFVAVTIYVYWTAFPAKVANDQAWIRSGHLNWEEGLCIGVALAVIAIFALWSGLNKRKWVFAIGFGLLSLVGLYLAYGAITVVQMATQTEQNMFRSAVIFVTAAVVAVPLCLRLAGYRVVSRKNAVLVTEVPESQTVDRWSRFASIPIAVVAVLWILIANISGAAQRHPFHCSGQFVYGGDLYPKNLGELTDVSIPVADGERLLRSPWFESVPSLKLTGREEVDESLIDAIAESKSLVKLEIENASISGEQFVKIASAKPWKALETRYPTGLIDAMNSSEIAVDDLVFNVKDNQESTQLTVEVLRQYLENSATSSILLQYSDSYDDTWPTQTPVWTIEEIARLAKQNPSTKFSIPLSELGRMSLGGGKLELRNAYLFDKDITDAIRVLQPKVFVSSENHIGFLTSNMLDEERESGFTAEQLVALEDLKQVYKCFETVVSDSRDAMLPSLFATRDRVELAYSFFGPLSVKAANYLADRKNIETFSLLYCKDIKRGAIEALDKAEGLKLLYYGEEMSAESVNALQRGLKNVEVRPLSSREKIPWE